MYEVQASEWGFGYVDTIEGHTAWIIADHPGNPSPGMNAIRVGFGANEIRLYSKMPIQDLIAVAATLSIVQAA